MYSTPLTVTLTNAEITTVSSSLRRVFTFKSRDLAPHQVQNWPPSASPRCSEPAVVASSSLSSEHLLSCAKTHPTPVTFSGTYYHWKKAKLAAHICIKITWNNTETLCIKYCRKPDCTAVLLAKQHHRYFIHRVSKTWTPGTYSN